MTHTDILNRFREVSLIEYGSIAKWSIKDRHTIKVTLKNGTVLIFAYESQKKWRLETEESYNKGIDK